MEVMELKVNLHCKACEMSTRKVLSKLKGVTCVDIDVVSNKVMVMGYVDQKAVIKAVRKTGRQAEVRPSPHRDSKILKTRSSDIASRHGYHTSPSRLSIKMHRASPSSLPKPSKEKQTPKALRRIKHMLCMRPRTTDEEPILYMKMSSKLGFQQDNF
ncbi:putative heavy metal-associated domain, HMA, heavy metal-associated domain superfamily [Dioscorea sansibarensis]